ncbi:MAG: cadherin-like domain-containing protein [Psychrosphaera sp.]|nr:cadherin-like domain-containing protein [Psychrosphaera sp.]
MVLANTWEHSFAVNNKKAKINHNSLVKDQSGQTQIIYTERHNLLHAYENTQGKWETKSLAQINIDGLIPQINKNGHLYAAYNHEGKLKIGHNTLGDWYHTTIPHHQFTVNRLFSNLLDFKVSNENDLNLLYIDNEQIYQSRFIDGQWSHSLIDDEAMTEAFKKRAILDSQGNVHVLYQKGVSDNAVHYSDYGIYYATDNNGKLVHEKLDTISHVLSKRPAFEVAENGAVFISTRSLSELVIYAKRPGTGWQKQVIDGYYTGNVSMALDETNEPVLMAFTGFLYEPTFIRQLDEQWLLTPAVPLSESLSLHSTSFSDITIDSNNMPVLLYIEIFDTFKDPHKLKIVTLANNIWHADTISVFGEAFTFSSHQLLVDNNKFYFADGGTYILDPQEPQLSIKNTKQQFGKIALEGETVHSFDLHKQAAGYTFRYGNNRNGTLSTIESELLENFTLQGHSLIDINPDSIGLLVDDNGIVHASFIGVSATPEQLADGQTQCKLAHISINSDDTWTTEVVRQWTCPLLSISTNWGWINADTTMQLIDGQLYLAYNLSAGNLNTLEDKEFVLALDTYEDGQWRRVFDTPYETFREQSGTFIPFGARLALDDQKQIHMAYSFVSDGGLPGSLFYGKVNKHEMSFKSLDVIHTARNPGIVVDSNGNAHISMLINAGTLVYASNTTGQWHTELVADYTDFGLGYWRGDLGTWSPIALDENELPVLAYYSSFNAGMMLVKPASRATAYSVEVDVMHTIDSEFYLQSNATGADMFYEITRQPAFGALELVNNQSGLVRFVPNADYQGMDSFTFRVFSDGQYSSRAYISLNIREFNNPPQVENINDLTAKALDSVTINVTAIDPDDDELSYHWELTSDHSYFISVVDWNTANLTFLLSSLSADITLTFKLTVSDGKDSTEITVNVHAKKIIGETPADTSSAGSSGGGSTGTLTFVLLFIVAVPRLRRAYQTSRARQVC